MSELVKKESLHFSVDSEWLCDFVRQRVYYEGVPYTEGIELLVASFSIDESTADDILRGKKKIVGINGGYLEDDNKFQKYLEYVARQEKKDAKEALEKDITLHPLKYFDPFAAVWSYKNFKDMFESKGKVPTVTDMANYFCREPADNDMLFKGGMYSLDSFATSIIKDDDDQAKFYEQLYDYWEYAIEHDSSLTSKDISKIKVRQMRYKQYLANEEYKKNHARYIIEQAENRLSKEKAVKEEEPKLPGPHWVINDKNEYSLVYGRESFYQRNAKLIPCEKNQFYEYGIISPTGDFYACDFASHDRLSVILCEQFGYFTQEERDSEQLADPDDERWIAKDRLYERGWIYVNTVGHNGFYSKWGTEVEDLPKKAGDTAYGWLAWNQGLL